MLDQHLRGNESPTDVQATLLELTAHAISNSIPAVLHGRNGDLPVWRWRAQPDAGATPQDPFRLAASSQRTSWA